MVGKWILICSVVFFKISSTFVSFIYFKFSNCEFSYRQHDLKEHGRSIWINPFYRLGILLNLCDLKMFRLERFLRAPESPCWPWLLICSLSPIPSGILQIICFVWKMLLIFPIKYITQQLMGKSTVTRNHNLNMVNWNESLALTGLIRWFLGNFKKCCENIKHVR